MFFSSKEDLQQISDIYVGKRVTLTRPVDIEHLEDDEFEIDDQKISYKRNGRLQTGWVGDKGKIVDVTPQKGTQKLDFKIQIDQESLDEHERENETVICDMFSIYIEPTHCVEDQCESDNNVDEDKAE